MKLFEELKRRNVFRVGIGYVITAWLLLQVADVVLNNIAAPGWVFKAIMLVLALGFPLALFFAWAFEVTPEGIKKEKDVDRSQSITPQTGQKLNRWIVVLLIMALGYIAWDKFVPGTGSEALPRQTAGRAKDGGEKMTQNPLVSKKSIAVLPFADLSQAKDQQWFADGLAEEILNALAKTPDLLVSSRTSSFRYKDSSLDLPDIARELGVEHILEGSVRSSGQRIRVTAQLIRASDGFHVWSENYDRDVADMISIQEDLASNIAKALETTMDPQALAAMTSVGTRSVEAYEQYLRGQALLVKSFSVNEGESGSYQAAYQRFEEARAIDPNFAAAHQQAADFWKVQLTPSRTDSGLTDLEPRQMLLEFNHRIDRAIATAPTTADKNGYMAYKAMLELRLREAMRLFRAYLQERPNDEWVRFDLETTARMASDTEISKAILARWKERGATDAVDAASYMNGAYHVVEPSIAADFGLKALQRWPNSGALMYQTHRTLMWAGRILEAKELAERYHSQHPQDDTLVRARQACAEGRRADAEAILETLDPNDNYARSSRWHILKLLGAEQQAVEVLRPYGESGVPYQLASWLTYNQFDPTPFPAVMNVLKREGVNRPAAVDIPFQCPPPEQASIAVLPFVNMSKDADNEFFSDGISEEILNVLARVPDLKVAARTSAFAYKGTNTKIAQIAQELGVNHVLEGSVRKAGGQVRVTAQLINAADGFHLWSGNYDRELTNIFAIQDEIAGSIADALKVSLKLKSGAAGNLTGTNNIEAYEHYLKGMSLWHERTVTSLRNAITEFEAATTLDPQFAKAHAGLALTWTVIGGYVTMDSAVTRANTKAAANRALALDANNVEALSALANLASTENRNVEAAELFKRVIALNPSFATVHQWYANALSQMSQPEAALVQYRQARALDPRSRIIGANLATVLAGLGRRQEAIHLLQEIIGFAPDFPDVLEQLLHLAIVSGDCEAAAGYGARLVEVLHKNPDATRVYLDLCQTADKARRGEAIKTMLSWPAPEFSASDNPSLSYEPELIGLLVDLGELEAAFTMINKFGDAGLNYMNYDLTQFRSKRTRNSITFYCDHRVQSLFKTRGIPPVEGASVCD